MFEGPSVWVKFKRYAARQAHSKGEQITGDVNVCVRIRVAGSFFGDGLLFLMHLRPSWFDRKGKGFGRQYS